MRRTPSTPRTLFFLLGSLTTLASIVHCTGDDPKAAPECARDDQCGPSGKCDLATGRCIGGGGGGTTDGAPTFDGPIDPTAKVIVLGQPDEFSNLDNELGVKAPIGVSLNGSRLVVGDYAGFRVLIYNEIPTTNLKRPDVVVGKPDLKTTAEPAVSRQTIYPGYYCDGVTADATRLFVADSNRNRGLIWNAAPTANFVGADNVVGAADFTTIQQQILPGENFPSPLPPAAGTLAKPCSMAVAGNRLFVADLVNNRVLAWNQIPTVNGRVADYVLGQPSFDSKTSVCIPGKEKACIATPTSVFSDGTRLWVSDSAHSRVLQWNTIPTTNNVDADVVIGQIDPGQGAANRGNATPGIGTLNNPGRVFYDGTHLFVADTLNNRVLMWNQLPTANGQNADVVFGQAANNTNVYADVLTSRTLRKPIGVVSNGTKVVISDSESARVLVYNQIPAPGSVNPAADVVIGRPAMDATRLRPPDGVTFGAGGSSFTDGKRFYVGDQSRLLVWDHIPANNQDSATFALGQENLTSVDDRFPTTVSAGRFHIPLGLWADDTRLVMSDLYRFRVLIWNQPITKNHQLPDVVLGQPTFDTAPPAPPNPPTPPSASSVSRPGPVFSDGTHLVLSDTTFSRVLIWDTFPTTNAQPANHVLGQANMNVVVTPETPTATSIRRPGGIAYDPASRMLFIADVEHHRVLGWKGWPTTDNPAATIVLGQSDFTSGKPQAGGSTPSAKGFNFPQGVVISNGRLYVADKGNNRILFWNEIPSENGRAADAVIGQPNMESGEANNGGLGPNSLAGPKIYAASSGRLWVNDEQNDRIVGLPIR